MAFGGGGRAGDGREAEGRAGLGLDAKGRAGLPGCS